MELTQEQHEAKRAQRTMTQGAVRRWLPLVVATLLGGIGSVALSNTPAQALTSRLTIGAGYSNCPLGYVCLWTLSDFTGTGYAFYNTESNYSSLPSPFNSINDNSWSFANNGEAGAWEDVRLYINTGLFGHSFVLCRGERISELPPNSQVDPSPYGMTYNGHGWRDRVSSHTWGNYCQ